MVRVGYCCCAYSLSTGGLFFAWIKLLISGLYISLGASLIYHSFACSDSPFANFCNFMNAFDERFSKIIGVQVVTGVVMGLMSISLMFGINRGKPRIITSFIITNLFCVVLNLFIFLIVEEKIMTIVFTLYFGLFEAYFLVVLYSLRNELMDAIQLTQEFDDDKVVDIS